MKKIFHVICFLLQFQILSACTDPKVSNLKNSVKRAKVLLNMVNKDSMSALSFSSIIETGGSPVSYIYAALPEDQDFAQTLWEEEPKPWTIILSRGEQDSEYLIRGFGDDTAEPLVTEKITLHPVSFGRGG